VKDLSQSRGLYHTVCAHGVAMGGAMHWVVLASMIAASFCLSVSVSQAQSEERIVYRENFDDLKAQDWQLQEGWNVTNRTLVGRGPRRGTRWARYRKAVTAGSKLILSFRLLNLTGGFHASTLDTNYNRYFVGFRQDRRGILEAYLLKEGPVGKFTKELARGRIVLRNRPPGGTTVTIVVANGNINVLVGGRNLLRYSDPNPIRPQFIGFEALNRSFVRLDDISVVGVRRARPQLSDLVVEFKGHRFDPRSGRLFLSVWVENVGRGLSPATTVNARATDLPSRAAPVQALRPGQGTAVEIALPIPDRLRGQEHLFVVEVDPDGRIAELNERNNETRRQIPLPWPHWVRDLVWVMVGGLGVTVIFVLLRVMRRTFAAKRRRKESKKQPTHPDIKIRSRRDAGAQTIVKAQAGDLCDSALRFRPRVEAGQQELTTEMVE
jgi:hypothetical protein